MKDKLSYVAYYFYCTFRTAITSHKTELEANDALINKASFYEYWAGSASVSVDNSEKTIVAL